ncbi:alpha-acetolactate decarboxylase [Aspergillus avenaceus]|uniref:Alpha-acetolactate decarboxylase n=1 Tax=Aspergillus avenaceus TaxID=36643 RepID=A0A5N6U4A8_ASPAV|nr:alpha-acetolactate decarboxylase [Aspergillus avenaceus]
MATPTPNRLYQYSVVTSLMEGICSQGIGLPDVLSRGDYGIGTVSGLDGEVMIVDGEAYVYCFDGHSRKVSPTDTIPFIQMTQFQPTLIKRLPSLQMGSISDTLSPIIQPKQNCFLSVKVDAVLDHIVFRVVPRQSKPRERLLELAKRQQLREFSDIKGTLFGFRSPSFTNGFSVAGFHLHFVSDCRTIGGHVLDFDASQVHLEAAVISEYVVHLPETGEFHEEPIGDVDVHGIHAVEGFSKHN